MFRNCRYIAWVLLLILVLGLLGTVQAQRKYPSRPISLICPWAAGGGTDRVARMIAVLLEKELGQPVNVINRTGGGGAVGHSAGATAAPNGYTLTMGTVEIAMMHWMGLTPISYKDFRCVAQVNFDPARHRFQCIHHGFSNGRFQSFTDTARKLLQFPTHGRHHGHN